MKRTYLLLSLLMLTLLPVHAQLTVNKIGQSIFGVHMRENNNNWGNPTLSPVNPASGIIISPAPYVTLDSVASAVFLGKEKNNGGAYVTFGPKKYVWVGELSPKTSTWGQILQLGGIHGIRATGSKGTIFGYTCATSNPTDFRFYADVRANSFIVDSDSRIKTNVKGIDNSSELLCALSPISYTLVSQSATVKPSSKSIDSASGDSDEYPDTPAAPSPRQRYGFMAQEVKELFPTLVTEDLDGTLGIDYIGFIPILVDAVKELRALAEEQQKEISRLSGYQSQKHVKGTAAGIDGVTNMECTLEQNRPNPFSSATEITCCIPESVGEAALFVYDLQGQQLLHIPVADRGVATVTIEASSLTPGMYIYSLIADDTEVDTKRMIVTD